MELFKPEPESAHTQLRALTMVARSGSNGLARPQRAMLDAIQQVLFETDLDVENLEPIDEGALFPACGDPFEARQLIRFMILTAIAEGPPSLEQARLIDSFSEFLKVDEPAVGVISNLSKNRMLRFRVGFARRAHIRTYMRNSKKLLGGVFPVVKAVLRFRGLLGPDEELASRFRALGDMPLGTLGREFHDHCHDAEIGFSGEVGGFPLGAVYHDFSHVLSGCDVSPEGEIKNAGFQAGFCKGEEDFFTTLFANLIHTAGINLTPFDMPIELGRIAQGTLAVDWLREIKRGSAMSVDLGDDWNFWDFVELPVDVAREKLGVPPIAG
ncbi:MAG: hypothetical protein OSB70_12235 [Myxococcota bacterium]|nr:hypothetical protein [Myxococcota bacterium]